MSDSATRIAVQQLDEIHKREDRIYDKLAQSMNEAKHGDYRSAARAILSGWRAIAGLSRDYGEAPAWFRRSKWEHEWTQIPESRLTETLVSYQDNGWQLVSATVRHPNAVPETMWVLIFKRLS